MSPIRRLSTLTTLALLMISAGAATPARAADPTTPECLAANESAIRLRSDKKLRQAREQSLVCSASSCPGVMRDACQKRVAELDAAIPSIVFLARDPAGHDLVAVKVSMDGVPIADSLDGSALPMEIGPHKFTFEVAGQPPVEQTFVIREGEKNRPETIKMGAVAGAPAAPIPVVPPTTRPAPVAPASSSGSSLRTVGVVVGVAGVVGIGLGAVFGVLAATEWSKAKTDCSGQPSSCTTSPGSAGFQEESSAKTKATVSTVGFIAGGVLVAGGVVVFLTAPRGASKEAPTSAARFELVPAGGPGSAGMMVRGWF